MKRALILLLLCLAVAGLAFAQQAAPTAPAATPPPPPAKADPAPVAVAAPDPAPVPIPVGNTPAAAPDAAPVGDVPAVVTDAQEARELPLDSEPFDVRVHRRVLEYNQRREQRERHLASYDQAVGGDPGLVRFSDPRKVQVELSDELDRERTSEELSADYAEQGHDVQSKAQALEEFLAKRRTIIDGLTKHHDASRRHDLETALANLARQPSSPEVLAAMREFDERLTEADREEKDLPVELSQAQQETADATAELAKLQTLQLAYEKEAKTFSADALSAHQNRLRLANKLEYFVVRAQAEDALEQGQKSLKTVQHLAPSSHVDDLLKGPASATKSDTSIEQMRDCIEKSGDVGACRQAMHKE
jgi:chromosome segregation ATPase